MPFSRVVRKRKAEKRDQENQQAMTTGSSALATPRPSSGAANSQDQVLRSEDPNGIEMHQNGNTDREKVDEANPVRHDSSKTTGTTGSTKKPAHVMDKSIIGQLRHAIFNSWINVLLVFVPVGIALHFAHVNPTIVFIINFIAIIPLAGLLSYGTEEIALRVGETLGGLLNATFGNAVELIVSIIALTKREVIIVQTSLVGSILSNLLLVMGMSFLVGGFNRFEQYFNTTVAQTASSLLALSITSLIIPTAFHWSAQADKAIVDSDIVKISRGVAIILLLVYASYLFFQLKTHAALFSTKSPDATLRKGHGDPKMSTSEGLAHAGASHTTHGAGEQVVAKRAEDDNDDDDETPELTIVTSILLLGGSTVLVALCAEFLVDSINSLVETSGISRYFVGLILLPIVGNAAEHATAVTVAYKDKMDLAIGVAVGSSMQIALLVIPFIVVLAWIMGIDEMTLYFDGFQVILLFASVLLVNYLIQDGKSNFLEGNLLLSCYIIIGIAAWFYPNEIEEGAPKR